LHRHGLKIWDRLFGKKRRAEARATLRHASIYLTPDTHVLDIGCGVGYALEVLNEEMDCVGYGCDVVNPPVEIPRFSMFDGARLPYRDGAVDVALLVFVLHHADDPGILLREASRVARRAVIVVEDTPRTAAEQQWGQMHVRSFATRHSIPWLGRVRREQEWRQVFQFSSMPVLQVERLGRFERLPPVSRSVFVLGPAPANIATQQIARAVTS
jgi:ubiquinone/menaquinone biosynthesis C-methylase UbiE